MLLKQAAAVFVAQVIKYLTFFFCVHFVIFHYGEEQGANFCKVWPIYLIFAEALPESVKPIVRMVNTTLRNNQVSAAQSFFLSLIIVQVLFGLILVVVFCLTASYLFDKVNVLPVVLTAVLTFVVYSGCFFQEQMYVVESRIVFSYLVQLSRHLLVLFAVTLFFFVNGNYLVVEQNRWIYVSLALTLPAIIISIVCFINLFKDDNVLEISLQSFRLKSVNICLKCFGKTFYEPFLDPIFQLILLNVCVRKLECHEQVVICSSIFI